jgi:glycosyltransferase involved in cell wall biosynthesis
LRLIKAVEKVNAEGFGINLEISGPDGWDNSELFSMINSESVKKHTKFLGFISDEELLNKYLSCRALIFPSLYEGFGIPVLEALKLNTPVLTSKGTAMEEVAGSSAMYFDPYDVNSIAGTIIKFLETGGVPIDHEGLDRYSWEKSAKDLLEVFEKVQKRA